jgi:Cu(I)/Ag(I) efflux system membrane fusion protein
MMAAESGGLPAPAKSDQELIAKQKTCPVSDALLGSMGTPVKVTVKGRTVFLCCAGCKAKLLKNPEKYLEKLDKQSKK